MKQVIALVFSDLHLNDWAKFNQDDTRTKNQLKVLVSLLKKSQENLIPVLFCGDFLHKPDVIRPGLLNLIYEYLRDNIGTQQNMVNGFPVMYAISGNHDMDKISTIGDKPVSWVKLISPMFAWMKDLDYSQILITDKVMIHGIPYIDNNIGLSEYLKKMELNPKLKHILMLHTDYPGAKDTDGREIGSVENLNINVLNRFDLVLCGHIHKPQRLSKKVFMIGAPIQQRRTDRDCKMGYWRLYDDLSMGFVEIKGMPKFIDVDSPDKVKDDGNYYTVITPIASKKEDKPHKITRNLSKKALARKYMKVKGIADKNKENLLINVLKETEQ